MKPAVILHIVVFLIAGVAAYFSLEHNRLFEEVRDLRLKTKAENKRVTENAEAQEKVLKTERDALADAEQKRAEATAALESMTSLAASVKREAADLEQQIKTQEEELVEMNKDVEEIAKILKDLGEGIELDNLGDKIEEANENKKSLEAKLEELETLVEGAEKLLASNREELERLLRREAERSTRVARNALESIVTAVNQDWGFIVIGAGANSGYSPQTPLLVKRDGRLIGRVTPSAVEATQTIAEIDFDSMATGVRIQPGDRVMIAKAAAN